MDTMAEPAPATPSPPVPTYPPGYQSPPLYAVRSSANGFAIASMVLGIVWIYWIGSILAIIFGVIALRQISQSNQMQTGRGMAIAGVVLGWVGIVVAALLLVIGIIATMNSPSSTY